MLQAIMDQVRVYQVMVSEIKRESYAQGRSLAT